MNSDELLMQIIEGQNAVLKEVADKLKTAGNTQTANKLHGINGLFSTPGLERDVISAHVRPHPGRGQGDEKVAIAKFWTRRLVDRHPAVHQHVRAVLFLQSFCQDSHEFCAIPTSFGG